MGVTSIMESIEDYEESILIYESRDNTLKDETFERLEKGFRTFCLDQLNACAEKSLNAKPLNLDREAVIRSVSNDSRLPQLKSRDQRIDFIGAFSTVCDCNDLIENALVFYERYLPTEVFCSYSPHTIESFVFMRALEECGVKVIKLINSPLPWIFLPKVGLSNEPQNYRIRRESGNLEAQKTQVNKYFSVLKGEYEQAIPYYDRNPMISPLRRLTSFISSWSPKSVFKYYEKQLAYRDFKKSVASLGQGMNYGVYFLHYQPESNTLPDAEIYNDQYLAIKKISNSLPDGMTLVIKEHPSTFSKRCDLRFRPKGFYQRLLSLPNTTMCPLDTPTFHLIDDARFVSSITGVCLTEALARGIPIIFFNSARFSGFPLAAALDASQLSYDRLKAEVSNIVRPSYLFPYRQVMNSFIDLVTYGYDGSEGGSFILTSVADEGRVTEIINLKIIKDFFEGSVSNTYT